MGTLSAMALILALQRLRPRRPFLPSRLRRDRGAAATLTVILFGTGAFFGVSALVVDVGQIYVERQEVQSGADAAATALAKSCALNSTTCANQAVLAAQQANDNARDGHTRVTLICGTPGTGLGTCPTPSTTVPLPECVGSRAGSYVEVYTESETSDGHTSIATSFVGAANRSATTHRVRIKACARAAWGAASSGAGIALTTSTCAWNAFTHTGTMFAPRPPALPGAGYEGVIKLHGQDNPCAAGQSGWNAPGGFGWLDDPTNHCTSTVSTGYFVGSDPGNNASAACKAALETARSNKTILYMPVFDGVVGTGQHATYHIVGFSAFVVTGYRLTGNFSAASNLTGNSYCSSPLTCVYGYFTTGLMPPGTPIGAGVNYGVSVSRLSG